jgi:hypothetical protein
MLVEDEGAGVYWDGGAAEDAEAAEVAEAVEVAVDAGAALLLPEFKVDGCAVAEVAEAVTVESPITT